MKPTLKSELYTCPKCNACFEVEQGEEMPGRYKLLKLVDGEWYAEGTYDTPEALAIAAYYLGANGYEQVKVERVV